MARLTLRIDLEGNGSIGPGKVRLLETIAEKGSIRSAAGALRMSYKRAWMLVNDLDETFGAPVVETETGGRAGGGARLSTRGAAIIKEYRSAERRATNAARRAMTSLERLASTKRQRRTSR